MHTTRAFAIFQIEVLISNSRNIPHSAILICIMEKNDLMIEDIGEFGFIRSIQDNCHFNPSKLVKGIGDDCAVIGPYENKVFMITTDLLLEDVHFILEKISPEHLGEKAVVVNLSDISAMGGKPRHIFVSLAIPKHISVDFLYSIYRGIKAICRKYDVNILGGDTCSSPERLFINVTVIGEAPEKEILYRNGARPGDAIYLTGNIGDAAAGLLLIREKASAPEHLASPLIKAHNRPEPFLEVGRMVARSKLASSMIDLSDGLASDLQRICEESNVGAQLRQYTLPLSKELRAIAEMNGFDPYGLALSGGEDYSLLITVPKKNAMRFQDMFEKAKRSQLFHVGEITKEEGIAIIRQDGKKVQLDVTGFDHFLSP